jgi:hypothetical protein
MVSLNQTSAELDHNPQKMRLIIAKYRNLCATGIITIAQDYRHGLFYDRDATYRMNGQKWIPGADDAA